MKYTIIGKNIEITEGLKASVQDKLGRLEKFFADDTDVYVTFSVVDCDAITVAKSAYRISSVFAFAVSTLTNVAINTTHKMAQKVFNVVFLIIVILL